MYIRFVSVMSVSIEQQVLHNSIITNDIITMPKGTSKHLPLQSYEAHHLREALLHINDGQCRIMAFDEPVADTG